MSPANTAPRFTPMRTGRSSVGVDDRAAACSSMRPSSSPDGRRRARGEDDLAAVGVDVGAEERDACRSAARCTHDDELVQGRGGTPRRPRCSSMRRYAVEVDERDGDVPVLGFAPRPTRGVPERHRDRRRDAVEVRCGTSARRRRRRGRVAAARSGRSSRPGPSAAPRSAGRSAAAVVAADDDLARARPSPPSPRSRLAAGPGDDELPVRRRRRGSRWNGPLCTPTDMRSCDRAGGVSRRPTLRSSCASRPRPRHARARGRAR